MISEGNNQNFENHTTRERCLLMGGPLLHRGSLRRRIVRVHVFWTDCRIKKAAAEKQKLEREEKAAKKAGTAKAAAELRTSHNIGGFEAHTKGIGAKLLAMMGFKVPPCSVRGSLLMFVETAEDDIV